jgi:hypothetical protein
VFFPRDVLRGFSNLMEAFIETVVGGVITFLVSRYYYKKASEELVKEANELRRLNNLMLRGMDYAGWIELQRDKEGNIIGFRQTITGVEGIKSEEKVGTPTITKLDSADKEIE